MSAPGARECYNQVVGRQGRRAGSGGVLTKGAQHLLMAGSGRPPRRHLQAADSIKSPMRGRDLREGSHLANVLLLGDLVQHCPRQPSRTRGGRFTTSRLGVGNGASCFICLLVAWGIPPGACMYRTTTDPEWADPNGGRLAGKSIQAAAWASHPIFFPRAGLPCASPSPLPPGEGHAWDMPPPRQDHAFVYLSTSRLPTSPGSRSTSARPMRRIR